MQLRIQHMTARLPKPSELSQQKNILVLDDDELFSRVLDYQLKSHGFNIITCCSSDSFMDTIKTCEMPDLFILDYALGEDQPTGLELCRKVKTYFNRPVIMLTGNVRVETLVSCLSAGADQYIVKPCDTRELVARIHATLRNSPSHQDQPDDILELPIDEDIVLKWDNACLAHKDGRTVALTQKEIALLEIFLKEGNRYIDKSKAFYQMYGYEMDPMNRSIDLLASRLRKKLKYLDNKYCIKNLRGYGYAMQLFSY
jgi:two-component system OmpR family response regulator